ncbi:UNVERIFIED_CONTAM: DNA-directed RNA polymerase subunit beta [Sesamum angustifolium]|uniref:DNA-directed RNA polymerase n=1 Tax=Sesamum angustifolium TaxID=2727405 RepID=A0AAW2IQM0_9LAMI
MRGWWGSLESRFMKFRRDQQGYDCFIYHQVEMNTICYVSGRKFFGVESGYSGRTGCSSSVDYCMGTGSSSKALMSSNMQRQAVPLSRSEKCIVGTGLERQAALDSGALALAERGGKIIYIDTDKILFSGNGDTLSIPLVMYQRSNKNTCMHRG